MYREYEGESLTHELLTLFSHHPGFIVSLAYLLLTIGGVFYGWAFYARFDVPFLQIADFSDFLISGIREPVSLIMMLGGLAVGFGFDALIRFNYRVVSRWREEPKSLRKAIVLMLCYTPRHRISVGFWIALAFVAYTWLFVALYAGAKSNQIRAGFGNTVRVYTASEQKSVEPVLLIGSTLNYVITFEPEKGQAAIIPVENIERIQPLALHTVFDD